jgi:hypothetical protein
VYPTGLMILWKEASSLPRLLYLTAASDTIRQLSYLCKFLTVGGTRVPGNPVVSVSHATYMMLLLQRSVSLFGFIRLLLFTPIVAHVVVLVHVHVERVFLVVLYPVVVIVILVVVV